MRQIAIIFTALMLVGCETMPPIKHGPNCESNAAGDCHKFGISYGTDEMQACIRNIRQRCAEARIAENRNNILQGGDWRTLLTTSDKQRISKLPNQAIEGLRPDILCAATRAELGYNPTDNILNEVKRRNLNCESLTVQPQRESQASRNSAQGQVQEDLRNEFEKCMAAVRRSSLMCTLGCPFVSESCRQVCEDRKIAQTDRCEARQRGEKIEYRAPVRSQPSPAPQPQLPTINPNVCVQDGGAMYCPNHPNTQRRDPLRGPIFR